MEQLKKEAYQDGNHIRESVKELIRDISVSGNRREIKEEIISVEAPKRYGGENGN